MDQRLVFNVRMTMAQNISRVGNAHCLIPVEGATYNCGANPVRNGARV
jgi:hypothetical protein